MKYTRILCLGILFLFFSIYAYAQSDQGNTRPTADAGADRNVKVGEEVELQGSGLDMENDPLTFTWAVVFKPVGSKAKLSDNNLPNPCFIVDVEGNYMFNLRVNDGQSNSLPDTVTYTAQMTLPENNKPTADAGTDRNVKVGEEVELQGSGSDRDNDTITFMWLMLSKPENSRVSLSNETILNPKLIVDTAGFYAIQLITNDGKENSEPDTVIINAVEPAEFCADRACDLNTKQWCDKGVFVSEGYCEHCRDQDNDCLSTIGGFCSDNSDCEAGLKCISWICSETKREGGAIPDEEKDSDKDGILDKWELEHRLDPHDSSDANLDFDRDRLTNLQEYTFGTNPNKADSDEDGIDDEEEIEKGTDPLDPVSKPGGIGRTLFLVVILVIVFGAGSYAVYYYRDYLIKPKAKTSNVSNFISRYVFQPVLRTPEEKRKIEQIVKKRRKAKKEKREKLFEDFYKEEKSKPGKIKTKHKKKKQTAK